jgi:GMP synthase (glutamine-hydrolysing)
MMEGIEVTLPGMKKLLIIKAGTTSPVVRREIGDFDDWILTGCGLSASAALVCPVYRKMELPDVKRVSAIIITGSNANVTDFTPWMNYLSGWLRANAPSGIPILGICFGHQLLAHTFGGMVIYRPAGVELGVFPVALTEEGRADPLFSEIPPQFPVFMAHGQTVKTLPRSAQLLSMNSTEPNAAFVLDSHIWGVQFHPEFSAEVLRLSLRQDAPHLVKAGLDPAEILRSAKDNPYGSRILKKFIAIAAAGDASR